MIRPKYLPEVTSASSNCKSESTDDFYVMYQLSIIDRMYLDKTIGTTEKGGLFQGQ